MTRAAELAIVIPCRNAADTLPGLLHALAAEEWHGDWEVIIADNGSDDGSRETVRKFQNDVSTLRVRIVDAGRRKGSAYARNAGVEASEAPFIAFCDADDVIGTGWVGEICAALDRSPIVASRYDFQRLNPDWLVEARGEHQTDGPQRLWYPPYALHAGGTGLAVRRDLHVRLGGFDEELVRLQDTDYCIRAASLGAHLSFAPDAVVHRRHRATPSGLFRQARQWATYNTLLYHRYRDSKAREGEASQPWRRYRRDVARLVRGARRSFGSRAGRARLAYQAGWQFGLLAGSVRFRVAPVVYHRHRLAAPDTDIPITSARRKN